MICHLIRPQQRDDRGLSAFSIGIRCGYWPCRRGPFISLSIGVKTLDLWWGLPMPKVKPRVPDDRDLSVNVTPSEKGGKNFVFTKQNKQELRMSHEYNNGDLVRVRADDSDDETRTIFEVFVDEGHLDNDIVQVTDVEGTVHEFIPEDLELVTAAAERSVHEHLQPEPVEVPTSTIEDVHRNFELMCIQLIQDYQARGCDGTLYLKASCRANGSDDEVNMEYEASIGYGDKACVVAQQMDTAYRSAMNRHSENKSLSPKRLTFQRG